MAERQPFSTQWSAKVTSAKWMARPARAPFCKKRTRTCRISPKWRMNSDAEARRRMEVTFTRTGERRYSVSVEGPGIVTAVMDPAPGYDPLLPHDMAHFVV